MSLPPNTVLIKRKRNEEPVEILRVQEAEAGGKRRRRATDFVFSRQSILDVNNEPASSQPSAQGVRRIKEIHRSRSSQTLSAHSHEPAPSIYSDDPISDNDGVSIETSTCPRAATTSIACQQEFESASISQTVVPAAPRRYHISRNIDAEILSHTSHGQSQNPKRISQLTVFVERKSRSTLSESSITKSDERPWPDLDPDPQYESRLQKKPGLNARNPVLRSGKSSSDKVSSVITSAAPQKMCMPSGLVMPWDVSSEQLAAEMQAYTLQEIGRNLAESDRTNTAVKPSFTNTIERKTKYSKFKPKRPAASRYSQRHPEEITVDGSTMHMDEESMDEDMDGEDYVIETYIRMPLESLESKELTNIGLLILDSQPDIDEFYRFTEDSEEEEEDEEEDENAENHYTADYPDEDVDTDDENGLNAYHYRTRNASDLEEFDEDEAMFSDDEAESTKYPWTKRQNGNPIDENIDV